MVLSRVVSIFLLIVIGFLAASRKIISSSGIRTISDLVLYVTLPFTIITGFDRSIPFSIVGDLLLVVVYAIGVHLLGIGVSAVAYRRMPDEKRKILSYITVFSNCGFMGFPIAESVFGKIGLMYASMYVMVFNIFIWTWGIALFSREGERSGLADRWRRVLLNPGTIAVSIGFAIWVLPFQIPQTFWYPMQLIANATTPLSMIVVGATLAVQGVKGLLRGTEVWIGAGIRLILIPLLVWAVFFVLSLRGGAASIAGLLASMPAAAQSVVFAERFDADVSLASRIVFITTVLSAITVPIAAMVFPG